MAKYLVDANLPYYFGLWNNPDFIHVNDLNDSWSDETNWEYARDHKLIIITKDVDFSHKVLLQGTPPKVIHCKFGNMRIKELHFLISRMWPDIETLIADSSLINVYTDRIEIIK